MLRQLNDERPIRRLGVTRRALFEEIDRPNLNALPAEPYSFAEWRLRRVGVDYHVELEGHFYSVPYRFARSEVEVRLTPRAVEIFLKGERIAAHLRASGTTGTPRCPGACYVSDLSRPTVMPCALRRGLEMKLVAQAQSRHPPHAATRLFRSRTFHPTARAKGRTEL